ncbi:MAG TPA: hypothetical protein PKW35_16995 [Nannocystaceae bacterium]|nr:hypothetical protein [Nannocystaceae bacterium]
MSGSGVPTGDDAAFRSVASELGVLMAPKPVDSADSLGLSAFAISADFSVNSLSNTADFWTKTTGGASGTGSTPGKFAPTMQIMGRKGLWPGIEVGAGATHLFNSRMWTFGGYGKVALHEGFHHLPIPSIALRGSFARLVGAQDMNMTTGSFDVSISHVFGVGKTFNITPYVGYQALMVFARSSVLDITPGTDEYLEGSSGPNEFVFKDAGFIMRHRPFIGARFIFSVLRLGLEAMVVPGGGRAGSIDGKEIKDSSGLQQQYTLSLGLDF